jgi:hypothetical protein
MHDNTARYVVERGYCRDETAADVNRRRAFALRSYHSPSANNQVRHLCEFWRGVG